VSVQGDVVMIVASSAIIFMRVDGAEVASARGSSMTALASGSSADATRRNSA
jgi:hypothetical protein